MHVRPSLSSAPAASRAGGRLPSWLIHFSFGFASALLLLASSLSLYAFFHGTSHVSVRSIIDSIIRGKKYDLSSVSVPVVVAFGDSLTQRGFVSMDLAPTNVISESFTGSTGWLSSLGGYLARKADVLNRGYSGFNTQMALDLGLVAHQVSTYSPGLVIMCFGANDAIDEEAPQHVALADFKRNMKILISQIKDIGNNVDIIVMSPPPVFEPDLEASNLKKNKAIIRDRLNDRTRLYAEASISVAEDFALPFIDLWTDLGGASLDRKIYLEDGLHFNKKGNDKVFSLIRQLLNARLSRWSFETMPFVVPPHYKLLN